MVSKKYDMKFVKRTETESEDSDIEKWIFKPVSPDFSSNIALTISDADGKSFKNILGKDLSRGDIISIDLNPKNTQKKLTDVKSS